MIRVGETISHRHQATMVPRVLGRARSVSRRLRDWNWSGATRTPVPEGSSAAGRCPTAAPVGLGRPEQERDRRAAPSERLLGGMTCPPGASNSCERRHRSEQGSRAFLRCQSRRVVRRCTRAVEDADDESDPDRDASLWSRCCVSPGAMWCRRMPTATPTYPPPSYPPPYRPPYVPPPSPGAPVPPRPGGPATGPPPSSATPSLAPGATGTPQGPAQNCQTVTVEGHQETHTRQSGQQETIWVPTRTEQICQ